MRESRCLVLNKFSIVLEMLWKTDYHNKDDLRGLPYEQRARIRCAGKMGKS